MDQNSFNKARRRVVLLAVILLLVIMSFSGMLNYLTFVDNYNQSLVKTYAVAGHELVRKIEYALQYGKPLDNFYGMNETLLELKDEIPEVEEVNIVVSDGEIRYSLAGSVSNRTIADELLKTANFEQGVISNNCSYLFYQNDCHIYLKISDAVSPHVASLEMVFPQSVFQGFNEMYGKRLAVYLGMLAALALCCLSVIVFKTRFLLADNRLNQKRVLILLILILGSVQMVFCGVNYLLFKDAYIQTAMRSKDFTEKIVTANVDSIYQKGLALEQITGMNEYLREITDTLPEIKEIKLAEVDKQKYRIDVTTSPEYIAKKMFDILLDMLTILVISVFFMIELTLLATILLGRQRSEARKRVVASEADKESPNTSGLVRALIFIINIGVFMSISFVPIVMNKLYEPMAGLSKDVALGLPISAEMLGGVLAIIIAGRLIDEKGWKPIFYAGILFLAAGCFLSGTSNAAVSFVLYRAIAGFGIGFVMMALRSLVVMLPEQNTAIAEFSAGAIAGLNCGAVIGGMLADRIGYAAVFYLSALLVIFSLIYAWKLLENNPREQTGPGKTSAWENFTRFVTDRSVRGFLLLVFIPLLIAGVFLSYFFPLFAESNNLSQGNISRAFLLNGLCIIYLGPALTGMTTRYLGEKKALVLSVLLVIAGMFAFMAFGNISAAFLLVILLGVSDSFGIAVQTSYFLNLPAVQNMGLSKGIGYFSIIVNIGKMLGPLVFGAALTWGIKTGVGVVAVVLAALLAIFIFVSKETQIPINSGKQV